MSVLRGDPKNNFFPNYLNIILYYIYKYATLSPRRWRTVASAAALGTTAIRRVRSPPLPPPVGVEQVQLRQARLLPELRHQCGLAAAAG